MTRSHAELVAENALLRQQLIVAARAVKRPDLRTLERGLLVMRARDATPFGEAPRFIIRDRDGKFGSSFDHVATGANMRVLKTAVRAPLMNSVCERFLGSVRRECLDHVFILGQRHLLQVLQEFAFDYF
ncbi:MAG: hypothetical protein ABI488_13280, partial [Polyangiaceae bacterium]